RFGSGSRFAPGLADVGTIVVTTRRQHQRKRDHGRDKTAELPHRQGLPPGRGSGFSDALTHAWDLDGDGAFDDGAAATASFTYSQPAPYPAPPPPPSAPPTPPGQAARTPSRSRSATRRRRRCSTRRSRARPGRSETRSAFPAPPPTPSTARFPPHR